MLIPSNLRIFSHLILFLAAASLVSACSPIVQQSSVALALEDQYPYHTGVEIAKPTYTPSPLPTATFTPQPTLTPVPSGTPALTVFADTDFVVIESLSPQDGYDSLQPGLAPVENYSGSKYILVDISEQHLYAYEAETLVFSFVASTGMDHSTRAGSFSVLNKIPNAYGATWNIWMPNWLGIYWSGSLQNGIHALPILPNGATLWAGFLGTPISYGCVVLGSYEAQLLYDWAEVGTPVEIRW